jgi:hypothetical protein
MIKRNVLIFVFLLLSQFIFAQTDSTHVEMADYLRSSGKIYVVISILITIFAVIIFFLIFLERKIKRLENKISNPQKLN